MKIIKRDGSEDRMLYRPLRSVFDELLPFSTVDDFFVSKSNTANLSADMWEEGNTIYIKMAVPGIKEEDLKVLVDNDCITISGQTRKEEKDESKKKYFYRSFESSFEQRFNLPYRIDTSKAEAKLNDGVITIRLPKSEEEKSREIKVTK